MCIAFDLKIEIVIYISYTVNKKPMKKCRGRPKRPRRVEQMPDTIYFKPGGFTLSDLKCIPCSRRA